MRTQRQEFITLPDHIPKASRHNNWDPNANEWLAWWQAAADTKRKRAPWSAFPHPLLSGENGKGSLLDASFIIAA